ncbi:MAG: hypothetical protein FDW93_06430 [Bergeyella sp.]|nr:hypothetical protein [Bergeyella sp.]
METNEIIDNAAKALETLELQYFIGVVDRKSDKVHIQSDLKGEDFMVLLDAAFPEKKDLISLGIWLGKLIHSGKNKKDKSLKLEKNEKDEQPA